MKYSGFQTCVDSEYFTPILITGGDTDLSENDICDVPWQWKEDVP